MKLSLSTWSIFWILCTLCAVVLFQERAKIADGKLHIFFLDVDQGDSTLIVTPEGEKIIIDGGPGTNILPALHDSISFFDKKIDTLILTHPQEDHLSGFIDLLDRYTIGQVLFSGIDTPSELYHVFLEKIQTKKIPVSFITEESDWITSSGVTFDLFSMLDSPHAPFSIGDINNTSLVLRLSYGTTSFLFMGDSEEEAEKTFLFSGKYLQSNVLKVGHHGSSSSSLESFLTAVSPQYAIISAGKENRFGHPHQSVLDLLQEKKITPFSTAINGTIHLVSDGFSLSFL